MPLPEWLYCPVIIYYSSVLLVWPNLFPSEQSSFEWFLSSDWESCDVHWEHKSGLPVFKIFRHHHPMDRTFGGPRSSISISCLLCHLSPLLRPHRLPARQPPLLGCWQGASQLSCCQVWCHPAFCSTTQFSLSGPHWDISKQQGYRVTPSNQNSSR